jgi:hypothetical protein
VRARVLSLDSLWVLIRWSAIEDPMSIMHIGTSFVMTDGSVVLLQGSFIASLSKKKMKRKGSLQMGDVPKY